MVTVAEAPFDNSCFLTCTFGFLERLFGLLFILLHESRRCGMTSDFQVFVNDQL